MKKIFTLICALMGFAGAANAATEDDIAVTKHSYVLICDDVTNNGTVKPAKETLVGDNHFLLAGSDANKSVSSGKGSVDLSVADGEIVTEELAAKYGEYGSHLNSLRLKNKQDMFVVKLTAGSKMIIFYNGQGKSGASARYPRVATDADLEKTLNDAPTAETGKVGTARLEVNIPDDGTYYVGSYNGDIFFSYVIIEAKEAPGTPTVKVGNQTFEGGLWFKEVTCKANPMVEEGSSESIPTVVYYTTDGSTPTTASKKYTEPIKCYMDQTIKFQAYMDLGLGEITEEDICANADNEGNVNFSFDSPSIKVEGATFTITSPYAEQNGTNFYSLNDEDEVEGNGAVLEIGNSAVVNAYTKIKNGDYATFTSKSATTDVYAVNPIKAEQTITISGTAIEDPEAETQPAFKTEDAAVNADSKFFFVINEDFGVIANADEAKAKYQAPEGQEVYLKMTGNIISFLVAAGDSVDVVVTCSKNSCKNIDEPEEEVKKEGSKVADNRKCFINVNGTNYGGVDLVDDPTGNVVKFGLKGSKTVSQNKKDADGNDVLDENGKVVKEDVAVDTDMIYTFQKYSGTGNILVSSIVITPVGATGIETIKAVEKAQEGAIYNLAGQKVSESYKGIVIKNGKKVVK